MPETTPVFRSWYSIGSSLLSLDEPGKAKEGGPLSVFDLAARGGLKEVTLVDDRIDGFIGAYKVAAKTGVRLQFGIKLCVCSDCMDKTPASRTTESKLIVFVRNTEGYHDLVRLYSHSWTDGHFTYRRPGGYEEAYGRTDWKALSRLWTPNLLAALPFFSSFLALNTLTFRSVVPDLSFLPPGAPPLWVFREVGSQLPFAPLIERAIGGYVEASGARAVAIPTKTILYSKRSDFRAFMVRRCISLRSTFDKPEQEHLCSDAFGWDSYEELAREGNAA